MPLATRLQDDASTRGFLARVPIMTSRAPHAEPARGSRSARCCIGRRRAAVALHALTAPGLPGPHGQVGAHVQGSRRARRADTAPGRRSPAGAVGRPRQPWAADADATVEPMGKPPLNAANRRQRRCIDASGRSLWRAGAVGRLRRRTRKVVQEALRATIPPAASSPRPGCSSSPDQRERLLSALPALRAAGGARPQTNSADDSQRSANRAVAERRRG